MDVLQGNISGPYLFYLQTGICNLSREQVQGFPNTYADDTSLHLTSQVKSIFMELAEVAQNRRSGKVS